MAYQHISQVSTTLPHYLRGAVQRSMVNKEGNSKSRKLRGAKQLSQLYTALTEAADTAGFCSELCGEDMAATACNRAPILCKLLSVGSLLPEDEHQLNAALHSCLWQGGRSC